MLRLTEQLNVPYRERNELLHSAGYAPVFPQRKLEDPDLSPVREALHQILSAHEPNPAVVVDRHWNLVAANRPMPALGTLIDPDILTTPVNVMRVGLHPRGLGQWIANQGPVHHYFVNRLEQQVVTTADPELTQLLSEVSNYPAPRHRPDPVADADADAGQIVTPTIQIRTPTGDLLSFFATVATFGTATEITTSELSIELAFAADQATAAALTTLSRTT